MELAAIENVVRVIFPLTMMRDGEVLPAAFKLREQQDGPEQYISVLRQFSASFCSDIQHFDKGRNLPCCILNVGEVNSIELTIADKDVTYRVKAVPTANAQSHGGIFIRIDGIPFEGSGTTTFASLNIGEEASFYILAIRRRFEKELDQAKEPELVKAVKYVQKEYPCLLHCLKNGVKYLCDVFRRIKNTPKNQLVNLVAHKWQPQVVPATY